MLSKPRQRPAAPVAPAPAGDIGIYIVDDKELARGGWNECFRGNPRTDRKLVCAGWSESNTADLPDLIRESGADLVLVDLVLAEGFGPHLKELIEQPPTSGVHAISAIGRALGWSVKIVAYSNSPQFAPDAMHAGADWFWKTGGTFEEVRQKIYDLIEKPPDRNCIKGLQLFPKERPPHVVVTGTKKSTHKFAMEPLLFAFLHYLAEERRQGRSGFVRSTGIAYAPVDESLWLRMFKQVEAARGLDPSGAFLAPPVWSTRISTQVGPFFDPEAPHLISPPRPRGGTESYTLHPRISKDQIVIHD